jgi:hypothetical protein
MDGWMDGSVDGCVHVYLDGFLIQQEKVEEEWYKSRYHILRLEEVDKLAWIEIITLLILNSYNYITSCRVRVSQMTGMGLSIGHNKFCQKEERGFTF